MAEYKTDKQVNYGFGLSFEPTGKAPIIAKRIWATLADAQAYVNSKTDTAIAGLQLSVINDTDANNGIYFVKSVGDGTNNGELVNMGGSADVSALTGRVDSLEKSLNDEHTIGGDDYEPTNA